jgi:hypothetical protein
LVEAQVIIALLPVCTIALSDIVMLTVGAETLELLPPPLQAVSKMVRQLNNNIRNDFIVNIII